MASNTYDRSLAFQAAEAALRAGEDAAQAQSLVNNAGFPVYVDADNTCPAAAVNTCNAGLCARPDKDCEARRTAATFDWINSTSAAAALNLGPLAGGVPRYFIEYLGNNYPNDPDDPNSCSGGPGTRGAPLCATGLHPLAIPVPGVPASFSSLYTLPNKRGLQQ